MGLDVNGTKFLLYARLNGVDFASTAMIGRQEMQVSSEQLAVNLNAFGFKPADANGLVANEYAEEFFRFLGSHEVVSFDVSQYEGAAVVHDFNQPIADEYKGRYSVVLDGGTLEHVFNYPTAIKNCMEMVRVGGHFLAIAPTNNQMGHGFYQFSPELFYRVLSAENGFKVEKMIIFEEAPGSPWYEVADPDVVKERVGLTNTQSTMLLIIARKTAKADIFRAMPQQSDYTAAWAGEKRHANLETASKNGFSPLTLVRNIRFRVERSLGMLNRRTKHFKKIDPR
jgi:hypothetical protein